MEFLKELLTEPHIYWVLALLQTILYTLILFTVAVLSWWLMIVIGDLKKRYSKTGDNK